MDLQLVDKNNKKQKKISIANSITLKQNFFETKFTPDFHVRLSLFASPEF